MIRPAGRADARALAELEVRAWRWAYVDIVAEPDMITVDERERRWSEDPLDGALVFDAGERIVGVVQIGDGEAPGEGKLRGLYVDPAAQGAGLGTLLHDHALLALGEAGFGEAILWTFTANGHAREFYAHRGWRPDDAAGEWRGIPELRMRRRLRA